MGTLIITCQSMRKKDSAELSAEGSDDMIREEIFAGESKNLEFPI